MTSSNPWGDLAERLIAALPPEIADPPPLLDGDPVVVSVTKHGSSMLISDDMAMDEGLIPDARPPLPPVSRWRRFRWRVREVVAVARLRVGQWVAGVDLTEDDDW